MTVTSFPDVFLLEALLCTPYDVILKTLGKSGKQCTVPCNPDYKMLIVFRMLLRIQKRLSGYYIKLHMASFLVKIGTNQIYKILKSVLAA